MKDQIVPPNKEGKKLDLEHSLQLDTPEEAKNLFKLAKTRLLHPSGWKELCGGLSANFTLTDQRGINKAGPAEKSDYVRIDIPAPGNKEGDGYDWVEIEEKLEAADENENSESIAITLRPAGNPTNDHATTAHFFEDKATSTFLIKRTGSEVKATYSGRNETINNATGNVVDNIRNSVVAAAAKVGVSEGQWERLIKAFLNEQS